MITMGGRDFRSVYEVCWNAAVSLEEMDRNNIDLQIICSTPLLFAYDKPSAHTVLVARHYNDQAIAICAHNHKRLKAMAQVPLQDIDRSCKELEHAMDIGHIGVQIGNHVSVNNLAATGVITFLHHAADIGMSVFVYPWDMMATNRMPKYMLPWLVTMPAETQLSMLSLILSGALEKLPETLKICFAHGGCNFAVLIGRVDNAWRHRDIVSEDCPNLPSSSCKRFYVDSVVFNNRSLVLLVEIIGEDSIMLGSDYPLPLDAQDTGNLIRKSEHPTSGQKQLLLGDNAKNFFFLLDT